MDGDGTDRSDHGGYAPFEAQGSHTTRVISNEGSPQLQAPSLAARSCPWDFSAGYSMSVTKVAGLAAVALWIMVRIVLPTVDTSSRTPRRWGLVAPVSGLGVNRMFP